MKKLLYPKNLLTVSREAMEFVISIAKLYEAKLYVLNILDNLSYSNSSSNLPEVNKFIRDIEEIARKELRNFISENFYHNIEINQIIKCGDLKEEVLKFSREEDIDLIVVSSKGLTSEFAAGKNDLKETLKNQTSLPVLSADYSKYSKDKFYTFENCNSQLNNFDISLLN